LEAKGERVNGHKAKTILIGVETLRPGTVQNEGKHSLEKKVLFGRGKKSDLKREKKNHPPRKKNGG